MTAPAHSNDCSSVLSRSDFDRACSRCDVIWKVIQLRRKRTNLGASLGEQMSAESAAQAIIARAQLAPAECIDRAYERAQRIAATPVAQRPRARAARRAKTNWDELNDNDE